MSAKSDGPSLAPPPGTIDRLHRAATTSDHPEAAAIMLEGVDLIVALVKQRGVGQAFIRAIDEYNEGAG